MGPWPADRRGTPRRTTSRSDSSRTTGSTSCGCWTRSRANASSTSAAAPGGWRLRSRGRREGRRDRQRPRDDRAGARAVPRAALRAGRRRAAGGGPRALGWAVRRRLLERRAALDDPAGGGAARRRRPAPSGRALRRGAGRGGQHRDRRGGAAHCARGGRRSARGAACAVVFPEPRRLRGPARTARVRGARAVVLRAPDPARGWPRGTGVADRRDDHCRAARRRAPRSGACNDHRRGAGLARPLAMLRQRFISVCQGQRRATLLATSAHASPRSSIASPSASGVSVG